MDTKIQPKITREQLREAQALPLEIKIMLAKNRIVEWYEHWDGNVVVSFSGGMDSTVLLHLVRSVFLGVVAVNVDVLQYPEIREHVKNTPNVEMIRPEKTFKEVIEQWGYPVISKRVAQYIGEVQRSQTDSPTKRLRLTGMKANGTFCEFGMIPAKWRFLCYGPFSISDQCCDHLKKHPFDKAADNRMPFMGTRAGDSEQRAHTYLQYGCNAFDVKRPRSTPLAFWTTQDIWDYVHQFNVPYARIYDMGYLRGTGCFACMFGVHLEKEPNRFQRMQVTHPQLWKYCVSIGIPEVLDYIGVSYAPPKQKALFEVTTSGKIINQWVEN